MNLRETIRILASIKDDAQRVLHKKIGKTKGLDAIEKQIRKIATDNAEEAFDGNLDRVAIKHIDRYVAKRMDYMRNAFKKLDNPKTDTSVARAQKIGDTESRTAAVFGKTKGYERRSFAKKKDVYKEWDDNDGCDDCAANAEEGPIPVDMNFQSGHYSPQAHPFCNCGLIFTDSKGNEIDRIDLLDTDEDEGDGD